MADSIVQGLFGVDPYQYQQQQQQALETQAQNFAAMTPMQRANYGIYKGASQIGTGVGNLLGMQDPQLQKAAMAKQLASKFDLTTPQGLQQYAQALAQAGAPDLAQRAIAAAQDIQVKQATVYQKTGENLNSLIASGKFTPASIALYKDSRNPADLELIDKGLTGTALEKVANAEQSISNLSTGNTDIDSWLKKVDPTAENGPEVTFGPTSTLGAGVSNLIGSPTKNALEQAKLRRFVAREANNILMAAKGTQTEGDAQRAYDMIMSGLDKNSNEGVYSALEDLKKMKEDTVKGLQTYVGSVKSKGKTTGQPTADAFTPPANAKYADDYARYIQKWGKVLPYAAYEAQRAKQQ